MHMQVMQKNLPKTLPCLCANVRRASRVLTQMYDDALRPLGLRSTQFSILQALSRAGSLLQGNLADFLALDTTALTRAVQLMQKHGWIKVAKGKEDRRERWLSLTPRGGQELARALPTWEKVQQDLRAALGEERWKSLFEDSTEVVELHRAIQSIRSIQAASAS